MGNRDGFLGDSLRVGLTRTGSFQSQHLLNSYHSFLRVQPVEVHLVIRPVNILLLKNLCGSPKVSLLNPLIVLIRLEDRGTLITNELGLGYSNLREGRLLTPCPESTFPNLPPPHWVQ